MQEQHGHKHNEHCLPQGEVAITVDETITIPPGKYTAKEIKVRAGVPLAFELEIISHGRLIALQDNESVEVKGGERFSAQPKCGVAS